MDFSRWLNYGWIEVILLVYGHLAIVYGVVWLRKRTSGKK